MITFKDLGHKGRLGNQLFQIAATVALAVRNNDTYGFPMWDSARYFNLSDCFHSIISHGASFTEPSFEYSAIPYRPDMNLYGYFQSEKYFADQARLIRELLTPKFPINYIADTVSLHVRRGDYLNLGQCFNVLGPDYYYKALEQIGTRKVMVFSEDMSWCKQAFTGNEFTFIEGNLPHVDIALQAACEHNIIANSSFSWWGAWLNKNPNKKVVAPLNWFGPELSPTHNTKDLIPEGWSRI